MIRLKGGAQYGYRGHILNVARDVTISATSLPWNANSGDVPIIFVSPGGRGWEGSEFDCSRATVENALLWLIDHYPAYANAALDITRLDDPVARGDSRRRDVRNRLYTIEEEDDGNSSDSNVGLGDDSRGQNYRGVGAPGVDGSDDDVYDHVDAARRGTRGTRAHRESFIPVDGLYGTSQETPPGGRWSDSRLAGKRGAMMR